MEKIKKWGLLVCFALFACTLFGQRTKLIDPVEVIQKITHNPSTKAANKKAENIADAEAYVYLTPAYAGKVKELVYHVRDLPVRNLNPDITVSVSGNRLVIPHLMRNIFEIMTLRLTDGSAVNLNSSVTTLNANTLNAKRGYSVNIFQIYSLTKDFLPGSNSVAFFSTQVEGSNAAAFLEKVALRIENDRQHFAGVVSTATSRVDPTSSSLTNCNTSNYWVVIDQAPSGNVLTMKNTCVLNDDGTPLTAIFQCYGAHNGNGDSYYGEMFTRVSGTACNGDLLLNPSQSSQQMMIRLDGRTIDFDCPQPPTCGQNWTNTGNTRCLNGTSQIEQRDNCNATRWINGGNACPPPCVPNPPPAFTVTNPGCGGTTGTVTVTNGNGGTFFQLDGGGWHASGNPFTNVSPGQHTIRSKPGVVSTCYSNTTTVTINAAPNTPTAPGLTTFVIGCDETTGTIFVVNTNGGTEFERDGNGQWQTNTYFFNVPLGAHTVRSRSSGGCISPSSPISLSQMGTQTPVLSAPVQPTCTNPNGSFTIINYGINGSYIFSPDAGVVMSGANVTAPPGTYTVTWRNLWNCRATSAPITINPAPLSNPAISITTNNSALCAGGSAVTTASVSPAGGTIQWMWRRVNADGTRGPWGNAGGNTMTLFWMPSASEEWQATYTVACGTVTSNVVGATVSKRPVSTVTLTSSGTICLGAQAVFNVNVTNSTIAGEGYTYLFDYSSNGGATYTNWWTSNAGAVWTGAAFTPTTPGIWKFRSRVSNSCGSDTAYSAAVIVKESKPQPYITLLSGTGCIGSTVNFTAGVNNAVAGEIYNYTFKYSKDNGATWTQWYNADNGNVWTTPSFSGVTNAGQWKFRIIADNGCGKDSAQTPTYIAKEPKPQPYITLNATTGCLNAPAYFVVGTNNGVPGEIYTYKLYYSNNNGQTWNYWWTENNTGLWTNPSYNGITTAGQWKFKVVADNVCGTDSAVSGTYVVQRPTAPVNITAVQPTCTNAKGVISIGNYNTVLTYTFSPSTGVVSTGTNTWEAPAGTYTITSVSSAGCLSPASAPVTINAQPAGLTATASSNQTTCSSGPVTLTATGGTTYVWHSGSLTGPVAGTTAVITVQPTAATNYYVFVSNGNCLGTASVLVQAPRPALILTSVITICKGNTQDVIADNNGIAGYTYRWLAPAAQLNVTTPTLHNMAPLVTTDYTVERTTPEGCKDTATSTIKVIEQPVIGVVGKTDAGCSGLNDGTITISATSPGGLEMEYSINGNTWQSSNVFTGLAPGAYSILVRNKNGICQASTGAGIVIIRTTGPQSGIAGPDRRCANEEMRFDASPVIAGATYLWSTTNNAAAGVAAPTVTNGFTSPSFTGTYATNNPATLSRVEVITLKVTLNGCEATYTHPVNVTQGIFANAGPDTSVCKGGQVFIGLPAAQAGPLGATFQWGPADKISGTTTASQFTTTNLTADQEYVLTVTDPVNGCTRTDRVFISVTTARNPIANAGGDYTLSAGQTATLGALNTTVTDATSISSYVWNTVSGVNGNTNLDDVTESQPVFTMPAPASPYTYELVVRRQYKSTSSTPGLVCFARDTVNIKIPGAAGVPDLTPVFTIAPSNVVGDNQPLECRIRVREILNNSTNATPVFVSIPVSSHYTLLPYDPTTLTSAGSPVQNSKWTYLGMGNGNYFWQYIGTPVIGAGGSSAFGFKMIYGADGASGTESIVVSIFDGSGGELNFLNNKDEEIVTYGATDGTPHQKGSNK